MTTIILAGKLMSMKLDRTEYQMNEGLKVENKLKKNKMKKFLGQMIEYQKLNKTCRLCLKPNGRRIFGKHRNVDIAHNIKYVLGIEVMETDCKPQYICSSCESIVVNAAHLKQTAEITQWRLEQECEMVTEPEGWNKKLTTMCSGYFNNQGGKITREWACGKCARIFYKWEEYTEHKKLPQCKSKRRLYMCETCGLEQKNMYLFKRHRKIHTTEFHYACSHCAYRARNKDALRIHERRHTGARPLLCPYCPATFGNPSNLTQHRWKHLPPRYHCDMCQKKYRYKVHLQDHVRSQHTKERPYCCNICGETFSTGKTIRRHEILVHKRPKMKIGSTSIYLRQQQEINT